MHIFLERIQLLHDGRFSSHFILLCLARTLGTNLDSGLAGEGGGAYLQLLHPVLTLGLLVLGRFCFVSPSLGGEGRPHPDGSDAVDIVQANVRGQLTVSTLREHEKVVGRCNNTMPKYARRLPPTKSRGSTRNAVEDGILW